MKFNPSKDQFTFNELQDFVVTNRPRIIYMEEHHEFWYRQLLGPDAMRPTLVTFRGLPIYIG